MTTSPTPHHSSLKPWIQQSLDHWRSEGVKLNGPASIEKIRETETILDFKFPSDFIDLYLAIDGFTDWDMTTSLISIWPLERIVEEYHESVDKNFLQFADYMILAWSYGFCRTETGVFNDNAAMTLVALTVEETIRLMNEDSALIY